MSSQINKVLQDAVAAGHVPNVIAVAADRNGVIYEGAAGSRAVSSDDQATPNSLFRIMSMTKMVCTVAALQQVESGNLELAASVDTYCPEFVDLPVLEGFDGDTPKLRPAGSRATVKQLVTHTTGLGYWFENKDLTRWHSVSGMPNVLSGSAQALRAPLVADPGTTFVYGINTDWLGKVVEAASGLSLDVCVKENITAPLDMNETAFLMNDEQTAKSVPVHVRGEDGKWIAIGEILNQEPDWWSGGHGLYSTPRDYLRFQRMLLGNGTLEGTKIVEPETVEAAFTNQIGDLDFPAEIPTADPAMTHSVNVGPGLKFGYGLRLNTQDVPGMRKAWSGAWGGLCNTYFWVDRTTGIAGSIYSQFLPFVAQEALDMYVNFEKVLYASL
jgi:CubicO group peptidase (beta-lactamase class C family)